MQLTDSWAPFDNARSLPPSNTLESIKTPPLDLWRVAGPLPPLNPVESIHPPPRNPGLVAGCGQPHFNDFTPRRRWLRIRRAFRDAWRPVLPSRRDEGYGTRLTKDTGRDFEIGQGRLLKDLSALPPPGQPGPGPAGPSPESPGAANAAALSVTDPALSGAGAARARRDRRRGIRGGRRVQPASARFGSLPVVRVCSPTQGRPDPFSRGALTLGELGRWQRCPAPERAVPGGGPPVGTTGQRGVGIRPITQRAGFHPTDYTARCACPDQGFPGAIRDAERPAARGRATLSCRRLNPRDTCAPRGDRGRLALRDGFPPSSSLPADSSGHPGGRDSAGYMGGGDGGRNCECEVLKRSG